MKKRIALMGLTVLAACTTISDVTPAGNGRYTVTTQVRGGMTPWGEVKASSLKRADEYCSQKGKADASSRHADARRARMDAAGGGTDVLVYLRVT
jgi:hypothetical protein